MKLIAAVFIFACVLSGFNATAQDIKIPVFTCFKREQSNIQKLNLESTKKYQNKINASCMFRAKPFRETELKSLPEGVCYTAFFCKLEIRIRDELNIWVKLRVGEFDDYEKTCLESK